MTIVANDSITVSNVNDGTITHTAWSYSADGTDRFTTVYPNLNLLDGTKDFSGTWERSSIWVNDGTYNGLTVKKQTAQLNGIYKTFTAPKDGTYTFSAYVKGDGTGTKIYSVIFINGVNINKFRRTWTSSFDWTRDSLTLNLKANDIALVRYEIAVLGTNPILWNAGHKWEEGSTATLWMPSSSEVTTADWPKYIGHYTDFMQADSTNPSDYTWGPMRGDDGKDGADGKDGVAGKDGKGIKATAITYQASTNGTTAPTGTWSASVPTVAKGSFLWTRTIWTYTDNTTETGYAVAYMGTNGNNGTDGIAGKDGVGIQTTTITYAGSTSGTTAPSTDWTTAVPTVAAGSYLWTKTVWTYTDNTSETGYSVARMGNNGATGPQGPQGLKGDPGATGIPGQPGVDGKTSYLHIAYATNSTGTTGFDVSNATGKTYIGQYTDFTSTDSTDPSKYTWSLIKGDKGDKGDPGIKGSDGTSGIIVSSVAPASPQTGQLWQDASITPQLVKKWTGTSWVIWELYAQNLKADNISTISLNLGDMTGGTVKLMADVDVNGTLKKHGIYQSKLGLLSSGTSLSTPSTLSNSQMGVANLNKGELRFMVTDYTEDLKAVQEAGMSDQNNAFIKFDSYDNGKDIMTIGSSGDIVFKGITSQDTPWIEMINGTYYKNMFSRVYISYSIRATSTANIPLGVLPVGLRPFRGLHLTANAWATVISNDRHIEVRTTGEVTLYNPVNGASYDGEVSFTL